jgi:translation initiation factor 2 beta subunit (eIF-2beta)/eIF-5
MTEEQKKFIDLAVIQLKKYDEISEILGLDKSMFSKWWDELKEEREELSKIRNIWNRKFENTNFWDFHQWYINTEKKCKYCGITETEIKLLLDNKQIFTKRIKTRGRTLEIDRKQSEEKYDNIENLTFCCYWCNNAKTDEFSLDEFIKVGKMFSEIWQERLKNKK